MVNSLEYRLEDEGHVNFAAAQKLQALNDAQRQVVAMCSNEALVHLQTSRSMGNATADTDLGSLLYFSLPTSTGILTGVTCTASNGRFTSSNNGLVTGDTVTLSGFLQVSDDASFDTINGLSSQISTIDVNVFVVIGLQAIDITTDLDSGVVEKKEKSLTRIIGVYDDTNDRFVELTSIKGLGENTSYNYGTKGALFNNRFYVSSSDASSDCTLIYITSPADITDTTLEITYISDSVQQAIVEIAESLLWRQDNRLNRAQAAVGNAQGMIEAINGQGV